MCHVLIIEDEVLVALDIQACLEAIWATSFAFAETELDAVEEARLRRPAFISSDVRLRQGTGPRAVAAIIHELGHIPVMYITGTPEECHPCDSPARVFSKPMNESMISQAFVELAPV